MRPAHRLAILAAAALGLVALLAMPGVAAAKDRNHDRIPDRWEKRHHLSLKVNQARRDQDHDRLRNRAEFLAGDNPRRADSDGDGIPDGEENAGTVQSFDQESGRLVIGLFGGETIAGQVTGETEIKCEHRHSGMASASDDGGGNQSSGDSQGEEEQGDDGSDEESGDDNEDNSGTGPNGAEQEEAGCGTADLVPGAIVHQAELKVENGAAAFEEIELAG